MSSDDMKVPRAPTAAELARILDMACNPMDCDADAYREALDAARVAVFDNYMSDSPGYTGRVAVVVWSGGPELFDVFTLDGEHADIQRKDGPSDATATALRACITPEGVYHPDALERRVMEINSIARLALAEI